MRSELRFLMKSPPMYLTIKNVKIAPSMWPRTFSIVPVAVPKIMAPRAMKSEPGKKRAEPIANMNTKTKGAHMPDDAT